MARHRPRSVRPAYRAGLAYSSLAAGSLAASNPHSALRPHSAVDLFFRDVTHRNTFKVPARTPVIFVCAPHSNQLIDPLIVMRTCPRPAGFLCAAKTLRKSIVGSIAKALDSIPVERPQDLRRPGKGLCRREGALVEGQGTIFKSELKPSDRLVVAGEECVVVEVTSCSPALLALANATRGPRKRQPKRAPRYRRVDTWCR